MENLQALTRQRDEILSKIREIESSCEGLENEHNAQRVQELNFQQAQLIFQKEAVSAKLTDLTAQLSLISQEIASLSGTGIDRLLDAIKKQRWYFFKNKTKVLLDRDTGLLWANLAYFQHGRDAIPRSSDNIDESQKNSILNGLKIEDYSNWETPTYEEIVAIVDGKFPFLKGSYKRIDDCRYWFCRCKNGDNGVDLDSSTFSTGSSWVAHNLPCNRILVNGTDYSRNVDPNNPNFNEKERLQFTLDLFVQNDLWPIFNDAEITELYQKIYYEKPKLLKKLQELQKEIDSLQSVTLLSAEFDEKALLAKYDRNAIDNSIIQYYHAVQQWTGELLEKLFYYEYEKKDVIQEMKEIRLKISELSSEQQNYQYFADLFAFDMDSVKAKIRSVKAQADALEQRIDDIDSGENALYELAELESQERASFSLIAENTAKIVRNALKKIEFFEVNREYVLWLVGTLKRWKNSLAKSFEMMKGFENLSEKGKVNRDVVEKRLSIWKAFRMEVEDKFQMILKKELRQPIPMVQQDEITIGQRLIAELEAYRNTVDTAYYERKLKDGNLSEYSEEFRNTVNHVVDNCAKAEDKIEILNIMDDLFQNKNA